MMNIPIVLNFRLHFAFGNDAVICGCAADKSRRNFAFFVPANYRGLFHEIDIEKVPLTPKSRGVTKLCECELPQG